MRGLTDAERHELLDAFTPDYHVEGISQDEQDAWEALLERGLTRLEPCSEREACWHARGTALGELALRLDTAARGLA